jgi:predicted secreted hydrolase
VSWASHLAVTDEEGGRFAYGQRSEVGPQVDRSAGTSDQGTTTKDFDLSLAGAAPWTMTGSGGLDRLIATAAPDDVSSTGHAPGFGLDLALRATRPPTLQDIDGWVGFGPAGGSYYYSRTRMAATGSLVLDGAARPVTGTAWFDHQWGDFVAVGGGGWDWFAVNLDDGSDLTASVVRARDGSTALAYGTWVGSDGRTRHLPAEAVEIEALGTWTSERTGATYPSGWRVTVPSEAIDLRVSPVLVDQELDTRASTGVIYWEGASVATGTRQGVPVTGRAYVELTGYVPAGG